MAALWKITVDHLQDTVLLCQVHTRHHEELFLRFLASMTVTETANSQQIDDLLERELATAYSAWADETIMVLGFVAAYHLWERQIGEVIAQQYTRRGETPPRRKNRQSVVSYARDILASRFGIAHDDGLWMQIDRSRKIVNAYKHGVGTAEYEHIKQQHPEFFFEGAAHMSGQGYSGIVVTRDQFTALMQSLKAFWDELPHETKYRPMITSK
jgi:hypothetical protein